MERATVFYSTVFDWEFAGKDSPSECGYRIFTKSGTSIHGGLSLVKEGELLQTDLKNVSVRIGIMASNIDATIKKVTNAGGKTLRSVSALRSSIINLIWSVACIRGKMATPNGNGFTILVHDSEGNTLYIWAPNPDWKSPTA